MKCAHSKFAHNMAPFHAIRCSPLGINALTLINLNPLPTDCKVSYEVEVRDKEMKKQHKHIRAHIEKTNEDYKTKANKNRKGVKF